MTRTRTLVRYNLFLEIALIALALVAFYPVFLVIADAFKTREEMAYNPFGFPLGAGFTLENIDNAVSRLRIYQPLLNSVIVTLLSTIVIIVISSMAAYPIARKKSGFYNFLYFLFLSGIIVPYQVAMIPLYRVVKALGIMNSRLGMVMIYAGILSTFPIFFYCSFVKTVPLELEEAARMDGAGRYRTFWQIVFPLLRPATAGVVVLNLLNVWNEFMLSFLFLQKTERMTITVALFAFRGQYHVHWPHMFAGLLVAIAPLTLLFLFAQRYFIGGVVEGALKG
jgi:raffinose/stachyose/melibiose transport system permease protein